MAQTDVNKFLIKVKDIVSAIKYRDWRIEVYNWKGSVFVRATIYCEDARDGSMGYVTSRSFRISSRSTTSEIVQTVFLMIANAEEHERREFFQYKGQHIFNPHFDVEEFVDLCKQGKGIGGAR